MKHDGGALDYRPAEVIATWPKGSFAENIAVADDGMIFVSLHTDRAIFRVNPDTRQAEPFAKLNTPVAGLAFGHNGSLYVSAGTPGQKPGLIWRIDREGQVIKAADLPEAMFLNGMTLHPDGHRLLVADSILGVIYAVDPATGHVSIWLSDEKLRPPAGEMTPGANGIKLSGGYAYISITARDMIVRVAVTINYEPGPVEVYAENLRADDFAVGADGALYIATHPAKSLVRLFPDGRRVTLAAAQHGMVGSTAVAFGHGKNDRLNVYVTTTGGTMTVPDDQLEEAKLVRVDVGIEAASDRVT